MTNKKKKIPLNHYIMMKVDKEYKDMVQKKARDENLTVSSYLKTLINKELKK